MTTCLSIILKSSISNSKAGLIIIIGSISLLAIACSPIIYYPKALNVPLLGDSGEIQANIGTGGGIGLQGSYAINHKFGITATYMGGGPIMDNNSGGQDKDHYFELGGINYKKIGSQVWIEGIGGIGYDKRSANTDAYWLGESYSYSITHINMDVRYTKCYLQGNLGANGKIGEIIISGRFAMLNFEKYDFQWQNLDENNQIIKSGSLCHHTPALFFEPGITMRLGYENFKLYMQICYAALLTNNMGRSQPLTDDYKPLIVGVGISTRFCNKSYKRL